MSTITDVIGQLNTAIATVQGLITPSALPAWLTASGNVVNQWVEIANTTQDRADLSPLIAAGFGGNNNATLGDINRGPFNFSGGALRQSDATLIIGGGGSANYAGNEKRALRLLDDVPQWKVPIPPSNIADIWSGNGYVNPAHPTTLVGAYYFDGRPSADHMYYAWQFIDQLNVLRSYGRLHMWPTDTGSVRWLDDLDWATGRYSQPQGQTSFYPGSYNWDSPWITKHPTTEFVYMGLSGNVVGQFNVAGQLGSAVANMGGVRSNFDKGVAAVDPVHNYLLVIGPDEHESGAIVCTRFNLANTTTGDPQVVTLTGVQAVTQWDGCGLVWDEGLNCFTYSRDDGYFYDIVPNANLSWSVSQKHTTGSFPPGGAAGGQGGYGIYNRMQYVRLLHGIVIAQNYNVNTRFIRTS